MPTDMMALIASSMVNWEGRIFSFGRKRRNPMGGTKAVGTKTATFSC
jgi:hypothetical protein